MNAILWRILIAVIVVVILFALIPLLLSVFNTPEAASLTAILRLVIGGLALLYVIAGPTPNWPSV